MGQPESVVPHGSGTHTPGGSGKQRSFLGDFPQNGSRRSNDLVDHSRPQSLLSGGSSGNTSNRTIDADARGAGVGAATATAGVPVPAPPRQTLYRGAGGKLYRFSHGTPRFAAATDVSPCYEVVGGGADSAVGGQVFRLCRVNLSSTGEEEMVAATRIAASRISGHRATLPASDSTNAEGVKEFDLEFYLTQAAEWKQQATATAKTGGSVSPNGVVGGATRTARLPIVMTATEATELGASDASASNRNSLHERAKRGLKRVFKVTEREYTTWAFYNDIPDCSVRVSVLFGPASQLQPLGNTRLRKGLEDAKASRTSNSSSNRHSSSTSSGGGTSAPQRDEEQQQGHESPGMAPIAEEDEEGPGMLEDWSSTVVERNRRNPQWIAECVVPPLTTQEFVSGRVKGGYRMRCTVVAPKATATAAMPSSPLHKERQHTTTATAGAAPLPLSSSSSVASAGGPTGGAANPLSQPLSRSVGFRDKDGSVRDTQGRAVVPPRRDDGAPPLPNPLSASRSDNDPVEQCDLVMGPMVTAPARPSHPLAMGSVASESAFDWERGGGFGGTVRAPPAAVAAKRIGATQTGGSGGTSTTDVQRRLSNPLVQQRQPPKPPPPPQRPMARPRAPATQKIIKRGPVGPRRGGVKGHGTKVAHASVTAFLSKEGGRSHPFLPNDLAPLPPPPSYATVAIAPTATSNSNSSGNANLHGNRDAATAAPVRLDANGQPIPSMAELAAANFPSRPPSVAHSVSPERGQQPLVPAASINRERLRGSHSAPSYGADSPFLEDIGFGGTNASASTPAPPSPSPPPLPLLPVPANDTRAQRASPNRTTTGPGHRSPSLDFLDPVPFATGGKRPTATTTTKATAWRPPPAECSRASDDSITVDHLGSADDSSDVGEVNGDSVYGDSNEDDEGDLPGEEVLPMAVTRRSRQPSSGNYPPPSR